MTMRGTPSIQNKSTVIEDPVVRECSMEPGISECSPSVVETAFSWNSGLFFSFCANKILYKIIDHSQLLLSF